MPNYAIRTSASIDNDRRRIGANIQRVREAREWSRADVAARCILHADYPNLYDQAIGRIERGEQDASLGQAVALASVLGCTLDELTRGLPDIEEHENV